MMTNKYASDVQTQFQGEILSPGIARGNLCFVDIDSGPAIDGAGESVEDAQEEIRRFETQVDAVTGELETIVETLEKDSYIEESEITKTHIMMLNDPDFHKRVKTSIAGNRVRAEIAVEYVLKETIARILDGMRPYDGVGRYGGEEFLILIPGADLAASTMICERIRKRIADEPMTAGKTPVPVTASLGVAQLDESGDGLELIKAADDALYKAKESGRNKVVQGTMR